PLSDEERVILLGTLAAEQIGKKVGDSVAMETERYEIAGIFESAALVENGAVLMTLAQAQRLNDKPGKVNILNVKLDASATEADAAAIRDGVRNAMPGFAAITS